MLFIQQEFHKIKLKFNEKFGKSNFKNSEASAEVTAKILVNLYDILVK